MSDTSPSLPNDLLKSAKKQLEDDEISLADNEEILQALNELTAIYEK